MATQVPQQLPLVKTFQKKVPPLSDAYRKAHKMYVLVSGLLASWELIGISIQTKEKWGIELKSPEAVPFILFTLVAYSGYKTIIEWLQCDLERRLNAAARIDYRVAHGIGASAIGISLIQYLAHIQIVGVVVVHERTAIGIACFLLLIAGLAAVFMRSSTDWRRTTVALFFLAVGMISSVFLIFRLAGWAFVVSLLSFCVYSVLLMLGFSEHYSRLKGTVFFLFAVAATGGIAASLLRSGHWAFAVVLGIGLGYLYLMAVWIAFHNDTYLGG